MSRKLLLTIGVALLALAFGVATVSGQGGQEFEEMAITTNTSSVVGVGSWVSAQAYGTAAGENPAEAPAMAYILPYGIHPDMHVMEIAEFVQPESLVEDIELVWSLTVPADSAAELIDGNVALFQADVEGEYVLALTATDANGNVGEASWTVTAAHYVGVGGLDGEDPSVPECATCHKDQTEKWAETGHSDMLVRGLNGTLSDHYGPNCISCHTVGFDLRAENGGFDDLVEEAGWTWPEELAEGGWDALVADYPELAGMANIQCESCHGPGSAHMGGGPISSSIDTGVCAVCHAEQPHHVFPQQWAVGTHGEKMSRAWWYPTGEGHEDCVQCHSGAGYIDYSAGMATEDLRLDAVPAGCVTCHDPHSNDNPNQLRNFDTVVLPEGEYSGVGKAATCMNCHNVRRDGGAVGQVERAMAEGSMSTPHHGNVQADLMLDMGGYTWGETLPTSPHGTLIEDSCIGCHMAATPGAEEPGNNTVGEHTFRMTSAVDGTANIAACKSCHSLAESFEFEARRDYDGDGALETNEEEIAGLRELLWPQMMANGLVEDDSRAGFALPETVSEDLAGAVWNYFFTEPAGNAVHNLRYTVSLLQLTYEKLAGEAVPGAFIIQ